MKNSLTYFIILIFSVACTHERYVSKTEIQEGYYLTDQGGMFGLIDIKGNVIIPNEYESIYFDGSRAITKKNGLFGLIDIKGNIILPNEYDSLKPDGSKVFVSKNGKSETIDL